MIAKNVSRECPTGEGGLKNQPRRKPLFYMKREETFVSWPCCYRVLRAGQIGKAVFGGHLSSWGPQ
jgi:hypothetical protein